MTLLWVLQGNGNINSLVHRVYILEKIAVYQRARKYIIHIPSGQANVMYGICELALTRGHFTGGSVLHGRSLVAAQSVNAGYYTAAGEKVEAYARARAFPSVSTLAVVRLVYI